MPNDPKLSHRRLAAWIATAAVTAVGSGDWLGVFSVTISNESEHRDVLRQR